MKRWLLVLCVATPLCAAPPTLTSIYPAGGQRGTTFSAHLGGAKGDTAPKAVWIDCPGVLIAPGDKRTAQITIAADAPLGLHLIRAYNDEGASEPRWFSIGPLAEKEEVEPNDAIGKEQALDKLPVCLNGKLGKRGDTDLFAFDLAKGQTLVAVVESYSLGIGVDVMLQLRNAAGTVIATANDARNLDPVLTFQATQAGRYSLQIAGFPYPPTADVGYFGGDEIIYRLHLSASPTAMRLFPAAISRKGKTKLDVLGVNVPDKAKTIEAEASSRPPYPLVQSYLPSDALAPIQVVITDLAVLREAEPNNTADKAMLLTVPACVGGRIDSAADSDRYRIICKKGIHQNIRLLSKALGLPLSASLSVVYTAGAELATSEGAAEGEDPLLSFKPPADGDFQIIVSDLYNKGSAAAEYVMMVEPGEETFSGSVTSKPTMSLEAGKSVEIKVKATRVNGYAGALVARVSGPPAGVTAPEVAVPAKSGTEFSLTLTAASDAMPCNGPFQVALWTVPANEKDKLPVQHRVVTFALRTAETQRGTSPLDHSSQLWITVLPAKP